MSRGRMPLYLGGAAVAGVGYYLYTAGGDGKQAQKRAEADANRLSNRFRDEFTGRGKDVQRDVEGLGRKTGSKIDDALNKSESEFSKAKGDAESYTKDAKDAAMKKIDEFDNKIESETSKAKKGVSNWFGGSSSGGGGGGGGGK